MSKAMVKFPGRVLMVGFGSVAQCTLPILVKHVHVPLENITVLDFEDKSGALKPWTSQGVRFVRQQITPENLGAVLGEYLGAGDLLIDLAWNIDCCEILQWCHDHGVLYINTSVEVWDPYDHTLYSHPDPAHAVLAAQNLRRLRRRLGAAGPDGRGGARGQSGPDLALHQAGLARHRRARAGREESRRARRPTKSPQLMADQTFNRLAMKLGVKVIHCRNATRRSPTSRSRSTSSSTPGASRAFAKRARRRPRWAGARTRRNCRRSPTNTRKARATRSAWRRWA